MTSLLLYIDRHESYSATFFLVVVVAVVFVVVVVNNERSHIPNCAHIGECVFS